MPVGTRIKTHRTVAMMMMMMRAPVATTVLWAVLLCNAIRDASSFVVPMTLSTGSLVSTEPRSGGGHWMTQKPQDEDKREESVASLVDDDEWDGVTMELTNAVSQTVLESVKKHAKDFLQKDEYSLGDITRQIDKRMKKAVANLRGKEDYEIGDLVAYVTEKSIAVAEETTGTKLEAYTDISKSIDKQVKSTVSTYVAGSEEGDSKYESGDLAAAVASKVKTRVADLATTFTEKEGYEVGDVSKKVLEEAKKYFGIGKAQKPTDASSSTSSAPVDESSLDPPQ